MKPDAVYVSADGVSMQPQRWLLARGTLGSEKALEKVGARIQANAGAVGCPISESGTLNLGEVYRDGKVATRGYFLPSYRTGISVHPDAPAQRYEVKLELTPEVAEAGRLTIRLVGERVATSEEITEFVPLPHRAIVVLRYRASEDLSDPNAISTWKELLFEEVLHQDNQEIRAVAQFRTLPEVDAIHHALTDYQAQCQVVVRCEAEIAFNNSRQVYLPKKVISKTGLPLDPGSVVLYRLPTAKPTLQELTISGKHRFEVLAPAISATHGPALKIIAARPTAAAPSPTEPTPAVAFHSATAATFGTGIHALAPTPASVAAGNIGAVLGANSSVTSGVVTGETVSLSPGPPLAVHGLAAYHVMDFSGHGTLSPAKWESVVAIKLRDQERLPSRFFGNAEGEPVYTRLHVTTEQPIDFHFDPSLHGYIYPPRAPGSGASLIRYAVAADQVIFQDVTERHVFYFLPDEFRLARDAVRAPTYKPSLDVAFTSRLTHEGGATANVAEGIAEYEALLTFRAVPYLNPFREASAQRYIQEQALISNGRPASLFPLIPDWNQLILNLPKVVGAGTEARERPEATVVFDKYVTDSLTLSSSQFAEVFHSMQVGGEALTGSVRYRLPGSTETRDVPFSGWLEKLVGPVLDAELLGPIAAPDGPYYRVRVINGIESKVQLGLATVRLLKDPTADEWILSPFVDNPFPMELEPGASGEFSVRPAVTLAQAFGIRLEPAQLNIALDFQRLWESVLETPGWDDIRQTVSVDVDASYFSGGEALTMVKVFFKYPETTIELSSEVLTAKVNLVRPFIPSLLGLLSADDFFYRVESWRSAEPAAAATKVAETDWLLNEGGSELTVRPPRG